MELLEPEDWWTGSFDQPADAVVVTLTLTELAGLAGAINEALEAVDDREFATRVGLSPADARRRLDQIGETLDRASRVE